MLLFRGNPHESTKSLIRKQGKVSKIWTWKRHKCQIQKHTSMKVKLQNKSCNWRRFVSNSSKDKPPTSRSCNPSQFKLINQTGQEQALLPSDLTEWISREPFHCCQDLQQRIEDKMCKHISSPTTFLIFCNCWTYLKEKDCSNLLDKGNLSKKEILYFQPISSKF